MWNKLKDWYKGEDIKYLYRLNKISLSDATIQIELRQFSIIVFCTVIGSILLNIIL